jgi:serine/threonine protein kinase
MAIPGTTVGSVRIERVLAREGGTSLWLGSQPVLERLVEIRELRRDIEDQAGLVEAFLREGRLGARVRHPNVLGVLDCFAHGGDHYLVLEHVEGESLRQVLDRVGSPPDEIATSIGLEVARGLEELHSRRIVLGALAPDRVVLTRSGEVKIRGLGHAREMGEEGPPVPDGAWRAPEIARGEPWDARADVYSLGAMIHELLTGETPVPGERPSLRRASPGLARIVGGCLCAEPRDRSSGVTAVLEALEGLLQGPSPAECRRAIADWLERPGAEGHPAERLLGSELEEPAGARLWPWAVGGALVGALLISVLLSGRGGPEQEPVLPPVGGASPGTGSILFVVDPWAEVQIDGGTPFLTPRARPLELAVGDHEVLLRHPELGTRKRTIRVKAGEQRVIREALLEESSS